MLRGRNAGFLGIMACIVFWAALFVLGALRPGYSHLTDAISELGALGTPNAMWWNLSGFVVPGFFLASSGYAIAASAAPGGSWSDRMTRWLLPVFGLAVAGQGLVPAVLADGEHLVTSWLTRGHLAISLISGLAWIVSALALVRPMKRSRDWHGLYLVNVGAVLLVLVGAFALGAIVAQGLLQRLVDAVVFSWFLIMSFNLVRLADRDGSARTG